MLPPSVPALLSINQFRDLYGIGRTKIYELINSGALDARKIGCRTLIPAESAANWLAAQPAYCPNRKG
ncbi:helix-turn-helix domain-containing protein [Rhizorhabdus wittichii DC-6]|nr:helix-turn-helix domain-containing protein [Rhizorhabdus wittichii DC-6]